MPRDFHLERKTPSVWVRSGLAALAEIYIDIPWLQMTVWCREVCLYKSWWDCSNLVFLQYFLDSRYYWSRHTFKTTPNSAAKEPNGRINGGSEKSSTGCGRSLKLVAHGPSECWRQWKFSQLWVACMVCSKASQYYDWCWYLWNVQRLFETLLETSRCCFLSLSHLWISSSSESGREGVDWVKE